jgi:heme A synthase
MKTMNRTASPSGNRRIAWPSVLTVLSAAILIGAEVFGAAFAGGWAVASYLDLGPYGVHITQGIFFLCGIAVMMAFIRNARRVEPFTRRG